MFTFPVSNRMKIAFFGTPDFTVNFLDYLTEHGYTPALVVTGVDVPIGRKLTLTTPLPKLWAVEHGIPCVQPQKITEEFIDSLKIQEFDLFVVIAYGKILPEVLINLPKYGTINVHYSLLPKYRGASPVESTILAGDTETGVCIQQMVYALDAGDILTQEMLAILPDETHAELRNRLNTLAYPLLLETIQQLKTGTTHPVPQSTEGLSICKKIKKEHGSVTLDEDPDTLYRKYRAYFGWPGIFFFDTKHDRTIRVKIVRAHMENNAFVIDTVTPEGKKEMNYDDYKRW